MPDIPPTPDPDARPGARLFSVKSVVTGLLFAVAINFFAGFAELLMGTRIIGSFLPPAACIPLLGLIVLWNPVMVALAGRGVRIASPLVYTSRELAVVLGFSLVACFAPTSNLFRYFHQALIMPILLQAVRPDYQTVVAGVDPRLFPLGGDPAHPDFETVYTGFQAGLASGRELADMIGPFDWPWRAWMEPVLHWSPLVLATVVVSVGLAVAVHRQWTRHEVLSYPLAQIYDGLIAREPARAWPNLFRDRIFWFGAAPVMVYHGLRAFNAYFPDAFPAPPSTWHFDLHTVFPALNHAGYAPPRGMLFFMFVGIAYFLASDVGFTLGVSNLILGFVAVQIYQASGRPVGYTHVETMRAGGYLAYGLVLLWVGREWYGGVLARAFGRRAARADDADRADAAWGARLVVVGVVGIGLALRWLGMPWVAACALSLFWPMFVLVISRLVCETGMPLITFRQFTYHVTTLLGPAAVGPRGLSTLALVNQVLAPDPRETLLPYVSTSLQVGEKERVRPGAMGRRLFVAALVALAAGFLARSWTYYNWGGAVDQWATHQAVGQTLTRLGDLGRRGLTDVAADATELGRFALIRPDPDWIGWMAAGFAVTAALALLRLRVGRWPIHPLLVLLWGSHAANVSYQAVMIGWLAKTLVVTYGGGKVYQRGKPFFIGLVAGEIAMGGLVMLTGFARYAATGDLPPPFSVFFP